MDSEWLYFSAGAQAGAAANTAAMAAFIPNPAAAIDRIIELLSVEITLTSAVATQIGLRQISARGTPVTTIAGTMTSRPLGATSTAPMMLFDAGWAVQPTFSGAVYPAIYSLPAAVGASLKIEWPPEGFLLRDQRVVTSQVNRMFGLQNITGGVSANYDLTVRWRERLAVT